MIKSWTYGTADIKNGLILEIEFLKQYRKILDADNEAYQNI